ncbi:Protein F17A9.4 [Aphelenchoides avenae]|nr:Protein F17A9.4 [Aphelenchus avenae]
MGQSLQHLYDLRLSAFDGIELHAAHGFLLAQFLSAKSNHRADQYGGNAENRVRILLQIYSAIRTEIPPSTGFAIGVTINSVEFENDTRSTEDAMQTAKALDDAGFDFVELSGGAYERLPVAGESKEDSTLEREAFFLKFLKDVRPYVRRSVVYVTGGFRTLPGMLRAVCEGIPDGIGLGRPAVAEPDIAKKLLFDGIRSVAVNHFEHNFKLSVMAATTQMFQAGSTSLSEANGDCCHGIVDLSTIEAAEKYKTALEPFLKNMRASNQQGVAKVHIFEYVAEV